MNGGMVPVAPMGQLSMLTDYIKPEETFVTCPNQDVAYGLGFFELDKEPVVLQVPDFGDPLLGLRHLMMHEPIKLVTSVSPMALNLAFIC
ncbi:Protein of uncharacterised function (DUF1254) [Enterobacter cloacae]|uniref:Protein of uncharacterized function (DUF1254) n=1 Tax=Enterobacter cloacae TaxID=550 RepID=A0A377M269_ENTCL|nr:Protein of uncharacterised function (DUF1254) [Enterobacter cloacae]